MIGYRVYHVFENGKIVEEMDPPICFAFESDAEEYMEQCKAIFGMLLKIVAVVA